MFRQSVLAITLMLIHVGCVSAETPVRIMTFNAEWLVYTEDETTKDPWGPEYTLNEHFERIAGVIESLEPDIVNLVEVTSADAVDYLLAILHDKGLSGYSAFHIESNDSSTGQDIAVITRHTPDVIDGAQIRKFYSTGAGSEWRANYTWETSSGLTKHKHTSVSKNAVYCFTIDGHKLGFLGLHLKALPSSASSNGQRTGQSVVAQKIIREEIVAHGYLPVVLGDLNDYDSDVPDRSSSVSMTDVLANLKDYDASISGDELVNAASMIDRQFDRYTAHWDKNSDGRPDENEPMTMIDHILLHEDLVPFIERVFIDHGHGSQTTDHWPVIVDLILP